MGDNESGKNWMQRIRESSNEQSDPEKDAPRRLFRRKREKPEDLDYNDLDDEDSEKPRRKNKRRIAIAAAAITLLITAGYFGAKNDLVRWFSEPDDTTALAIPAPEYTPDGKVLPAATMTRIAPIDQTIAASPTREFFSPTATLDQDLTATEVAINATRTPIASPTHIEPAPSSTSEAPINPTVRTLTNEEIPPVKTAPAEVEYANPQDAEFIEGLLARSVIERDANISLVDITAHPNYETIYNDLMASNGLLQPLYPIGVFEHRGDGHQPGEEVNGELCGLSNQETCLYTGMDILALEDTPVHAPLPMTIVQIIGGDHNGNNEEMAKGGNTVIGYVGDWNDEINNTQGGMFFIFENLKPDDELIKKIAEQLGRPPKPHEVVSFEVTEGEVIGRVGNIEMANDPNQQVDGFDYPSITFRALVSVSQVDGISTDIPSNGNNMIPGVRYITDEDGTTYVQQGDIFTRLSQARDVDSPDSLNNQWPFGSGPDGVTSVSFPDFYRVPFDTE